MEIGIIAGHSSKDNLCLSFLVTQHPTTKQTSSLWHNLPFQLSIQYIYLFIFITIITIHSIRLYLLKATNDKYVEQLHKFCKLDIRHLSFLAIIPPSIIILQNVFIYTINIHQPILTNSTCITMTRTSIILSGIARFAMLRNTPFFHLSQTVHNQNKKQNPKPVRCPFIFILPLNIQSFLCISTNSYSQRSNK